MKYKVGDTVRIIENESGHYFNKGEYVVILKLRSDGYNCSNGGAEWYVVEQDLTKDD